jgi:hypothetical protein
MFKNLETQENKKNVFIIALGQLAQANMSKSINAFTELVKEQSVFSYLPFLAKPWVYASLILDSFYYKTIDTYKKGNIGTEEFRERLCRQLGIKNDNRFDLAWNAMSSATPETTSKINQVVELQHNAGFKLCIVTATNELQYNHALGQLNESLRAKNLPELDKNPNISIVKSFEKKELSLEHLAAKAISENNYDQWQYNIVSLNNKIVSEQNLKITKASFTPYPNNERNSLFWYESIKDMGKQAISHIKSQTVELGTPTQETTIHRRKFEEEETTDKSEDRGGFLGK